MTLASPYSKHLRKCKQQLVERNTMIDKDLGYKYATPLMEAEKAYRDSEGDLDSAVLAALECDRVNDLPSVDQIEILAWNLYMEYCIGEDVQRVPYGRPVNWEGVKKSTWTNIARRAIQMMEFAR